VLPALPPAAPRLATESINGSPSLDKHLTRIIVSLLIISEASFSPWN
jgi:hypothetical protein